MPEFFTPRIGVVVVDGPRVSGRVMLTSNGETLMQLVVTSRDGDQETITAETMVAECPDDGGYLIASSGDKVVAVFRDWAKAIRVDGDAQ